MPFLDYVGLERYKENSDKLYLPVFISGTLTGAGSSVTGTYTDQRITDTMVPHIEYSGDTSVISGDVTVTVDTGRLTVTAVVNGTISFVVRLSEEKHNS